MTEDQKVALRDFEARVRGLMMAYRKLRDDYATLEANLAEVKGELAEAKAKIVEQEDAYKRLMTARMIEVSADDVKESRARIAKLIREVDKCIALLDL